MAGLGAGSSPARPDADTGPRSPGAQRQVTVKTAVLGVPLSVAPIVTLILTPTFEVLTVNVAFVCPPATLTDSGTVALPELLERPTTTPAAGAALPRVTVPVAALPPTTLVGLTATDTRLGGLIVKIVSTPTPLAVAETAATVCAATATVLTVKVAEVLPRAIVTATGGLADFVLLLSLTLTALTAGPLKVTVPVEDAPPATVLGLRLIVSSAGGSTVKVAAFEAVPRSAVIFTVFAELTADVPTVNVAEP